MNSTTEILIGIGAIHLIAFGVACALILMIWHSDDMPGSEGSSDEGTDGGGGIRTIRPRPSLGGPPLPDASVAGVRFRGPGRLGRGSHKPTRRPSHDRPRSPVRR